MTPLPDPLWTRGWVGGGEEAGPPSRGSHHLGRADMHDRIQGLFGRAMEPVSRQHRGIGVMRGSGFSLAGGGEPVA